MAVVDLHIVVELQQDTLHYRRESLMIMQDSGKQLNEDIITQFEELLNIKLPQDYKDFMLENNGGMPLDGWVFDFLGINNISNRSVIQNFKVIYLEKTDSFDDINNLYKILVEEELAPPSVLPIADDPSGNIIFLVVSKKDYGKIYFGEHELEDPETGYLIMSPIANSFSEFINKCYIDTE